MIFRRDATKLLLLVKNNFLVALLSYSLTISLANHWGAAIYGQYNTVMLIGNFAVLLIMYGTNQTAPVMKAEGRPDHEIYNSIISFRFVVFILVQAISLFALVLFSDSELDLARTVGVFALTVSSLSVSFTYEIAGKMVRYSYIYLLERLIYIISGYALVFTGQAGLVPIFMVLAGVSCASILFQHVDGTRQILSKKLNISKAMGIFCENWPFVLAQLASYLYNGGCRLIIGQRLGYEALGVYSAGWQVIVAATLFQSQVDRVWRLRISEAVAQRNVKSLATVLKSYLVMSSLPILLGAVFVNFFASQITDILFTASYSEVASLLAVFSWYFVVLNLDGLCRVLWLGAKKQKMYLSVVLFWSLTAFLVFFTAPIAWGLLFFAKALVILHGMSVVTLLLMFYSRQMKRW